MAAACLAQARAAAPAPPAPARTAPAQTPPAQAVPAPASGNVAPATPPPALSGDTLEDALACRTPVTDIPRLLTRLRRERPSEFVQTERQYSAPAMDLYRLDDAVEAWGNAADAIVITDNRVLMLVDLPQNDVAAQLERALEQTRETPLAGALDNGHALVVYAGDRPGLQGYTLIGCEYRTEGLSLLDDPDDAWRKPTR